MAIVVNGRPADSGCYVGDHQGQYAGDVLAEVAESFGFVVPATCDPRFYRRLAAEGSTRSVRDDAESEIVNAGDRLVDFLNTATVEGVWEWDGGAVYLSDWVQD